MKVLCLRKLTGHCTELRCPHGTFHEPAPCAGATCRTRTGTCAKTDYITECMILSDERMAQLESFLEPGNEA